MTFKLETERLILREWQDSDLEVFARIVQDKEIMHHYPDIWNAKQVEDSMVKNKKSFAENKFCFFPVILKESKSLIGFTGINKVDFEEKFTPAVEIGWIIDKKYWKQGFASEAAKKVLEYGFAEIQLNEIVSFTAAINTPSQKLMEKVGMRYSNDFYHPKLNKDHNLALHKLYRIKKNGI